MLSDRACSDLRRSNRVRSRPTPNAQPLLVHYLDRGLPVSRGLGHSHSSPHIPVSRTKLPPGSCPQEREGRQNGLGRRPVVKAASGR